MHRVLTYANMYYIIFSISTCEIYAVYIAKEFIRIYMIYYIQHVPQHYMRYVLALHFTYTSQGIRL